MVEKERDFGGKEMGKKILKVAGSSLKGGLLGIGGLTGKSPLSQVKNVLKERKGGQENQQLAENAAQRSKVQDQQNQYQAKLNESRSRVAKAMNRNRRSRGNQFGDSRVLFSSAEVVQPGAANRLGG